MTKPLLRKSLAWLVPILLLSACKLEVLAPSGDVAAQQRDMLVIATLLMLVIILPVLGLICFFAWRYRASNGKASYRPDWAHSTKLELAIWGFPVLIIIALGALTWVGTHLTDPYRPLNRISATVPLDGQQPLDVQVVALDWKWLFIYPEEGVAALNELVVPVDRPVRFHLTSSTVMNAFYIPAMAGMIYAMPGMETTLNGVINNEGTYQGIASHYSGHGFSGMRFKAHAVQDQGFDEWVAKARAAGGMLGRTEYLELERPTENEAPRHWAEVDPQLYHRVVNMCVEEGKMCMAEMMAMDQAGGGGLAGTMNLAALTHDKFERRGARAPVLGWQPFQVAGYCSPEEEARMFGVAPTWAGLKPVDPSPLRGMGLSSADIPFSARRAADLTPPPAGALPSSSKTF